MKIMKILLTSITILFAGFGLFKVLSFDIANPIMLVSLATLLLLRGIEYKNDRDKSVFILNLIAAMFVYVVVIYNVFWG
nr:hypothetical protein [uncultured Blautia sp.]